MVLRSKSILIQSWVMVLVLVSLALNGCYTLHHDSGDAHVSNKPQRPSTAEDVRLDWEQYVNPEEAGWASESLASAYSMAERMGSASVMGVYMGNVLFAWGEIERPFMLHSIRKSLLSMMYGMLIESGAVRLDSTLGEIHVDDIEPLSELEKSARVIDLLRSTSGVYLPAAYAPSNQDAARPHRGAHAPGTHWYYNNWDFNVLGTIYNNAMGDDLFDRFIEDYAMPLGMQDFGRDQVKYVLEPSRSQHPAYTFRMSARDLARVGQLFLDRGVWHGNRLVSESWITESVEAHVDFGPSGGFGFMWWIYPKDTPQSAGALRAFDKYAALGTGGQMLLVVPDLDLVLIHRGDTDNRRKVDGNVWELFDLIVSGRRNKAGSVTEASLKPLQPIPLSGALPVPDTPTVIELSESEQARLVGEYAISDDITARVYEHNKRLFIHVPGKGEAELFATSMNDFTLWVDPQITIHFMPSQGPSPRLVLVDGQSETRATRVHR